MTSTENEPVMNHLINIQATPAVINGNFDEIQARLEEYLRDFDVVVTPDHVGDAKKLRTELRKQISELDNRIKDALKDASEPIRQADERRKQLVQLGKDVDEQIKLQVDRCEDDIRFEVEQMLDRLLVKLWDEYAVTDEFRRAEWDDLVKLTARTKKGQLTKPTKDALDARVREDKALQDRTERRIAELAGASYEAGLASPLTRQYLESFLFAHDDDYQAKLQRLIDAEVERQAKAEQRAREQQEREQQAQREAEQREADRQRRIEDAAAAEHSTPQEQAADPVPDAGQAIHAPDDADSPSIPSNMPTSEPAKPATDGKVAWMVVATFEIRTPPHVSTDAIRAEARRVLEGAGIKTLRNVTAQRKPANAA